ncbi:MAG TPA: ferritin-like domain-containing protein [bacterium]|nr:ferritin-like domain-containing protein [bacterium]
MVQRWRGVILGVAAQEMLHLALVQNLLSAIGAAPHLSRPHLPAPAGHYPAGVQLALMPFGGQALGHFMCLERPERMALDDAEGLAAIERATPIMELGEIVPRLRPGRSSESACRKGSASATESGAGAPSLTAPLGRIGESLGGFANRLVLG